MRLQEIKEINLAVKELNETALYASFANSVSYAWFCIYAIPFLVYPLLIAVYFLNAIINLYELYKSPEKSFDDVFLAVCNFVGTSLALSSMIGTMVLSSFAVGPILFLTAVVIGFLYNLTMATINIICFMDADRKIKFKHAAILNVYNALLLTCIIVAVIGVLIAPFNSIVVAIFSIAAAVLMAGGLLNRIKNCINKQQASSIQTIETKSVLLGKNILFQANENNKDKKLNNIAEDNNSKVREGVITKARLLVLK